MTIVKRLKLSILILLGILWCPCVHAGKLELATGYYSFSAETSKAKGEHSNFGAYRLLISRPVHEQIDVGIGYSLLAEDIVTGDLVFGFDLAVRYFPVTPAGGTSIRSERVKLNVEHLWRPFLGVGFQQRQFQSIQTTYAGFSVSAGVERALEKAFDLIGELRYTTLAGPNEGEANEIMGSVGLSFEF